jgi:hypothetical protein
MSEKLDVSLETITPEWARTELAKQEKMIADGEFNQRRVDEDTVAKYANDMRHGHWLINTQGIGFNTKGHLIDGRHRLWAVMKCGKPVQMMVFRGLKDNQNGSGSLVNVIDTIDCGRTRSISSQLQIDGVKNALSTAAAARNIGLIFCWPTVKKFGIIPIRQILAIYGDEIQKIIRAQRSNMAMRGAFIASLAMYHQFKPRKASEFLEKYATLTNLPPGSPVLAIRKFLEVKHFGSGTDGAVMLANGVALGLYHYDREDSVTNLRGSDIGRDWLCKNQANNRKLIREMVSLEN